MTYVQTGHVVVQWLPSLVVQWLLILGANVLNSHAQAPTLGAAAVQLQPRTATSYVCSA